MYKIYKVHDNFSEDGRDPTQDRTLCYTTNEKTAKLIADGRGNYGHDAIVSEAGYVCDGVEDYEYMLNKKAIDAALAKLTPEEKRLLKL